MDIQNFYSNIGKNATECEIKCKRKNARNVPNLFNSSKKIFIDMLKKQDYQIVSSIGNYITVKKNDVSTILYFSWHNQNNKNYLLNKYIMQRVDYFAFCSCDTDKVYFISYDKISKYCRNMSKSVRFRGSSKQSMMIPDNWVQSQIAYKIK